MAPIRGKESSDLVLFGKLLLIAKYRQTKYFYDESCEVLDALYALGGICIF
jgi:hypothetical protein